MSEQRLLNEIKSLEKQIWEETKYYSKLSKELRDFQGASLKGVFSKIVGNSDKVFDDYQRRLMDSDRRSSSLERELAEKESELERYRWQKN